MPYYRHDKSTEPETGRAFATMVDARAGLDPKAQIVTFVASDDERESWQDRETKRFRRNEYLLVPWLADRDHSWSHYSFPDNVARHYPHRSLDNPDLIAYTKNDEHGVNDRQTRVKPGRYLEEFFKDHFTPDQIADYIARCKASTVELKIARSPEDIVAIYSKEDCGFSSCMQSKRTPEYPWQRAAERGERDHPCAVYGDSDLGVAYMGDIAGKITARAVVWPDTKQYTRVYGDATLTALLRAHGYTHTDHMIGARVRYLTGPHGVIMPYVDGLDSASKTTDDDGRPWIILDNEGSINCDCVGGYGNGNLDETDDDDDDADDDERLICARCGDTYRYGEQGSGELNRRHCDECLHQRERCDGCGERTWQEHTTIGDDELCPACYERATVACKRLILVRVSQGTDQNEYGAGSLRPCDATWVEREEFTPDECAERARLGVSHVCRACAEHKRACVHCAELFDVDDLSCARCGLAVPDGATAELFDPAEPAVLAENIVSPIDGSIWWRTGDNAPSGFWVKFVGMRADCGWYVDASDAGELTENCHVGHSSSFGTLDNSPHFYRVADPRIAIRASWEARQAAAPVCVESVF